MVSGKCISHFKMLWSVSGTYREEVALTSPFFFWLFYSLQENSRVILSLLLGFRLVWAPSSMSYKTIIGRRSCWTKWTTFPPIPNWVVWPSFRRRWLFGRIIFACFYRELNDPSITQSHSWGHWSKGCCRSSWIIFGSLGLFARRQPCGRTFLGAKDTVGRTISKVCIKHF